MTTRLFRSICVVFSAFLVSTMMTSHQARAVHWSVEGPGVTDLVVTANKVIFSYNLDVRRSYGVFEWKLTGHDHQPGTHMFNWDYDGTHDRRQNATILRARDQELVSAGTGRGTFLYEGKDLVLKTTKTEDIHFRMLAENDDATKALTGTLELTIVDRSAAEIQFLPDQPAKPFPMSFDELPAKPYPAYYTDEPAPPFPLAPVPVPAALLPFVTTVIFVSLYAMRKRRSLLRNNTKV